MIINRNQSVKQNLVNLIKESNPGLNLNVNQFDVVSVTPDTAGVTNNTRIKISARNNAGFKGTIDLWYKRCTITEGLASPITSIARNNSETNTQLQNTVVELLNLLTPELTIVVNSGKFVITAKAESQTYIPGSTWEVTITEPTTKGVIVFDSVLVNTGDKIASSSTGFALRSIYPAPYGALVSISGSVLLPMYNANVAAGGIFSFSSSWDSINGYNGPSLYIQGAGAGLSNFVNLKIYNHNTNVLVYESSSPVNISIDTLRWPLSTPGWTLQSGVRYRAEFS